MLAVTSGFLDSLIAGAALTDHIAPLSEAQLRADGSQLRNTVSRGWPEEFMR